MGPVDNERSSMNSKFRSRLRELLDESGNSQAFLARSAGVSAAVISKYLSDPDKEPLFHIVAKIARHFDVSPEWLGGMSDERTPFQEGTITDIYFRLSNAGKTELYNYGQYLLAKEPNLSEDGTTYVFHPPSTKLAEPSVPYANPTRETVAVKIIPKVAGFTFSIAGDSMEPLIKEGAVVFAKDQSAAESGDIIIAEVDGTITCKKLYREGVKIELQSINPSYEPITDFETIRIIGKVII